MTVDSLTLWLQALSAGSTIVAAVAVIVGIRQFRAQMNAQTFIAYTDRYEQIIGTLPSELRVTRFGDIPTGLCDRGAIEHAFLRYFNMASEEFYLKEEGYLDQKLWKVWEDEIRRTIASPLGRSVWTSLRGEFVSYPAFFKWVERTHREVGGEVAASGQYV